MPLSLLMRCHGEAGDDSCSIQTFSIRRRWVVSFGAEASTDTRTGCFSWKYRPTGVLFFFYRVPMSIEPFSQAAACLADVGHSTHSASNEVNYTYRLAVELPADRVRVATGDDHREVFHKCTGFAARWRATRIGAGLGALVSELAVVCGFGVDKYVPQVLWLPVRKPEAGRRCPSSVRSFAGSEKSSAEWLVRRANKNSKCTQERPSCRCKQAHYVDCWPRRLNTRALSKECTELIQTDFQRLLLTLTMVRMRIPSPYGKFLCTCGRWLLEGSRYWCMFVGFSYRSVTMRSSWLLAWTSR